MEDTQKKRAKVSKFTFMFLFLFVIISILAAWWGIDNFIPEEDRGIFGDKFGSVNALFSGLAFAGLICTILLQNEDLELTRNELRAQKIEAQKQNQILRKQEFHTMYFNFLTANRNIVNQMKSGNRTGQEYIEYTHFILSSCPKSYSSFSKEDYLHTYKGNRRNLSYYFKSLHNLIHFVNDSIDIDSTEKKVYFGILMSHLSDYEIMLFFYDNIYRNSDHLIKTLIEHYSLFYKFPDDLLINEVDKVLYEKEAYGV